MRMNRRAFLLRLGIGAAAAVVAPKKTLADLFQSFGKKTPAPRQWFTDLRGWTWMNDPRPARFKVEDFETRMKKMAEHYDEFLVKREKQQSSIWLDRIPRGR